MLLPTGIDDLNTLKDLLGLGGTFDDVVDGTRVSNIAFGSYEGSGGHTKIFTVGFNPKAAIIFNKNPNAYTEGGVFCYDCIRKTGFWNMRSLDVSYGGPATGIEVETTDVSITFSYSTSGSNPYLSTNGRDIKYFWIIFG